MILIQIWGGERDSERKGREKIEAWGKGGVDVNGGGGEADMAVNQKKKIKMPKISSLSFFEEFDLNFLTDFPGHLPVKRRGGGMGM